MVVLGFHPSPTLGCTDYACPPGCEKDENIIPGDGNVKFCMVNPSDVGRFVARVIADPRTLNRMVLTNGESVTLNELYDMVDDLSGEKAERVYMSAEQISPTAEHFQELIKQGATDFMTKLGLYWMQYFYSLGMAYVRDNTPEYAEYLGYPKAGDLYPDLKRITYKEFFQGVLEGKARKPYTPEE